MTKLDNYDDDARLALLIRSAPDVAKLFLYSADKILSSEWHWLQFLFQRLPPHPVALKIVEFSARAEAMCPGLGFQYIDTISSKKNREKNNDDYDAIVQVLAEILVIDRIFDLSWADGATFEYEPKGKAGKRPEIRVISDGHTYLFEVKAPSLIDHHNTRAQQPVQLPGRGLPKEGLANLISNGVVLPRDNPVKDFLLSAEAKFSDFDRNGSTNILIIVWDDHIYEPITSLVQEKSGLLTVDSFLRDDHDNAVLFPSIDAVVIIRHLNYFFYGLGEHDLQDRPHLLDFGDETSMPNVLFPLNNGREIPDFVSNGLRALYYGDETISMFAEYTPSDIVFWV